MTTCKSKFIPVQKKWYLNSNNIKIWVGGWVRRNGLFKLKGTYLFVVMLKLEGGWVGQNQSERCSNLEIRMKKWTIPYRKVYNVEYFFSTAALELQCIPVTGTPSIYSLVTQGRGVCVRCPLGLMIKKNHICQNYYTHRWRWV